MNIRKFPQTAVSAITRSSRQQAAALGMGALMLLSSGCSAKSEVSLDDAPPAPVAQTAVYVDDIYAYPEYLPAIYAYDGPYVYARPYFPYRGYGGGRFFGVGAYAYAGVRGGSFFPPWFGGCCDGPTYINKTIIINGDNNVINVKRNPKGNPTSSGSTKGDGIPDALRGAARSRYQKFANPKAQTGSSNTDGPTKPSSAAFDALRGQRQKTQANPNRFGDFSAKPSGGANIRGDGDGKSSKNFKRGNSGGKRGRPKVMKAPVQTRAVRPAAPKKGGGKPNFSR